MVDQEKLSAVLIEFAHTLVTNFPIQSILDRLVVSMVDILDVTAAGVTLISSGEAPHYIAASNSDALGFEQLQTRLWQGPCLTAYDSGLPVAIPDLADDDAYPDFGPAAHGAGMAAVFTFPLRHGEVRLGALDLYRDTTGPLSPQSLAAAQTLADVAAAYLINAQARQDALDISDRFRHAATHDVLTGLPNRNLLAQRLEHAAQRAQRSHGTAAVLFVDVDAFKAVNDTHGHFVGDALLVGVAERLSGTIRPGDTLARVSGDEFVILCEDLKHRDDAEMLAARIHACVAEPFSLPAGTVRVTASVGIAYAGAGELVSDKLIQDADSAMYEAKRGGGASHRTFTTPERGAPQAQARDDDPNAAEPAPTASGAR